jgi:mRNA-degrading endonuclease RelE of RelBE toxin-antitoxin system
MKIIQTSSFMKTVKKLHDGQKKDLDVAVRAVMNDPLIGEAKTADLTGVSVYKFKMVKQLTLLAYTYQDKTVTLTVLALTSHENFYRDLKRSR